SMRGDAERKIHRRRGGGEKKVRVTTKAPKHQDTNTGRRSRCARRGAREGRKVGPSLAPPLRRIPILSFLVPWSLGGKFFPFFSPSPVPLPFLAANHYFARRVGGLAQGSHAGGASMARKTLPVAAPLPAERPPFAVSDDRCST